jgi:glycosyltransferase involved in cell wall biosynthesis
MNKNTLLSIVIPTYNRAEFLDYSLEVHIPICKDYNIQIFISDNASTDNTENVVKKWMKEYEHLHYNKNEINIGPDGNFEKALKFPDTKYIWLLSDTYQLPSNGVEYLLDTINNTKINFDVIVFNLANIIKLPTKNYQNHNDLLHDLGAIMTCAAINVYNKKIIDNADFSRYYNSSFIQTGIIFEAISRGNFLIHWAGEYSVSGLEKITLKKTNWSYTAKAFEIGCEKWTNFVMSLPPSYKLENKMKCIMDFGKVSGIFTIKGLVLRRMINIYNLKEYLRNYKIFSFTISFHPVLTLIIALTPIFIVKLLAIVYVLIVEKEKKRKINDLLLKK